MESRYFGGDSVRIYVIVGDVLFDFVYWIFFGWYHSSHEMHEKGERNDRESVSSEIEGVGSDFDILI
jgi:hypothetical protein